MYCISTITNIMIYDKNGMCSDVNENICDIKEILFAGTWDSVITNRVTLTRTVVSLLIL